MPSPSRSGILPLGTRPENDITCQRNAARCRVYTLAGGKTSAREPFPPPIACAHFMPMEDLRLAQFPGKAHARFSPIIDGNATISVRPVQWFDAQGPQFPTLRSRRRPSNSSRTNQFLLVRIVVVGLLVAQQERQPSAAFQDLARSWPGR